MLAADGDQPLLRRRSGAGSLLFCACDIGSQVRAESVVAPAWTAALQRGLA